MVYKHFIITRFNINFGHNKDKFGIDTLTDNWMDKRFELFERFCFPSVKNQSVDNFEWLLLFDENTPQKYQNNIQYYQSQLSSIIPVYLSSPTSNFEIVKSVLEKIPNDINYIITTRIDNDDAMHRDHILEVQKLFDQQNDCFIRFINGYNYHEPSGLLLKRKARTLNHFCSRIEAIKKGVETVIAIDHTKISELDNVEIIDIEDSGKRLWVEVVHETNVSNRFRLLIPEIKRSKLKEFNVMEKWKLKDFVRTVFVSVTDPSYLKFFISKLSDFIRK